MKTFNTDHYFEIGSTHEVCQDYAISGVTNGIAYAIITDGCSESHKLCGEVDFGARVVAYAAKDAIHRICERGNPFSFFGAPKEFLDKNPTFSIDELGLSIREHTWESVVEIRKRLRLSPMFADSTLVVAITDGEKTYAYIFGDGGIIVAHNDGRLFYNEMHYSSSAPYYMSYIEDKNRAMGYQKEFASAPAFKKLYTFHGTVFSMVANQAMEIDSKIYKFSSFEFSDVKTITVTSDGIKSYQKISEGTKEIDAGVMVPKFVSYKGTVGSFVQRRMKALKKDCEKDIISHYDDISVSSIVIDNP